MKITKPTTRKDKKEIYNKLLKSDSLVRDGRLNLMGLKRQFLLKRDKELLDVIINRLEWCNDKLLLLEGRMIFELGSEIYMGGKYLQFSMRHWPKKADYSTKKIVPLRNTSYNGKKFEAFIIKDLGAKAEIMKYKGKIIILSIFIPRDLKHLIKYN